MKLPLESRKNRRLHSLLAILVFTIAGAAGFKYWTASSQPAIGAPATPVPFSLDPSFKMPNVQVKEERHQGVLSYERDLSFTTDWFSGNIPIWEKALKGYKNKPMQRYLEVGVYEGRSLFWMLENILTDPTSSAVAIDPFLEDSVAGRYRANLAKSGFEKKVTTIVGFSQIELRKLPLESFDLIYIDGSHKADDVLEDAILCLRLLKSGGMLVFDDYRWTGRNKVEPPMNIPGPAVDIFYALYRDKLDCIHNGYQAILRKR